MFGNASLTVDVYRKARPADTYGDALNAETDGAQVAGILAGRTKVHTIDEAVIGPTASEQLRTAAEIAPQVRSRFILYTAVEEDIKEDDYVAFYGFDDKLRVLKVSGAGDLDYFSPYSGISVKETYLDVIKSRGGI